MIQSEKPDTLRAFVAFELPDAVVASIQKLQQALKGFKFNVRWVRTQHLHLTLKFLGDIGPDRVTPIHQALAVAAGGVSPLTFTAQGLGAFPGIRRARVLWVGLTGDIERLLVFQREIDRNLAQVGFGPEQRPFKAHLTLGRVKGNIDARQLLEAFQRFQDYRSEPFTARRIELIKSDLRPEGPVYSSLAAVALG
jgi:2'-5' RNA ligase